jgi:hypothetical protein
VAVFAEYLLQAHHEISMKICVEQLLITRQHLRAPLADFPTNLWPVEGFGFYLRYAVLNECETLPNETRGSPVMYVVLWFWECFFDLVPYLLFSIIDIFFP